MKNKILKSIFVCSLAIFALTAGVKGEDSKKKPIVMQQFASAEESVVDDGIVTSGTEDQTIEYQEDKLPAFVKVCGKAKTQVAPDGATIFARIENFEKDISLSKENNYKIFDDVTISLKNAGASQEDIKIECFNCQPSYDYSNGRTLNGYYATTSFSVEINSIDKLDEYVSAITDAGVTSIDSVCYKASNMEEEYNKVLGIALENAKEKAESLLGCVNPTLVKLKEGRHLCGASTLRSSLSDAKFSSYLGKIDIEAFVVAEYMCE